MKTTIDIPDNELNEVLKFSKAKTKREAVVIAITEYNRRKRRENLAGKFGTYDGFISREELEKLRADE